MHIAICYHEDGSEPYIGRIGDHLMRAFGRESVSLCGPRVWPDFHEIGLSGAVLPIIGPRWEECAYADPQRLAEASGVRVIPVTVAGGRLPDYIQPYELQYLGDLRSFEVRHHSFNEDVGRLVDELSGEPATDDADDKPWNGVERPGGKLSAGDDLLLRRDGAGAVVFLGPTVKGPVDTVTQVDSFDRYLQRYGGGGPVASGVSYMAHAARAFFDNGGRSLFVARVVGEEDLIAMTAIPGTSARFYAGSPGSAGNGTITVTETTAPASWLLADSAPQGTLLRAAGTLYLKSERGSWTDEHQKMPDLDAFGENAVFVSLSIRLRDQQGFEHLHRDLALAPVHPRWIGNVLTPGVVPERASQLAFEYHEDEWPGCLLEALLPPGITDEYGRPSATFELTGGADGALAALHYDRVLEQLEQGVGEIIAAPGSSRISSDIRYALLNHAEGTRRLAVLEMDLDLTPEEAVVDRAQVDSTFAMLCYPWVEMAEVGDAEGEHSIAVPATGAICGMLARNDVGTGVHKALTNELLRGVVRPVTRLSEREEEWLISQGVNCIRSFPGAGARLRGGRLACSGSDWQFVNLRRYMNYLEQSIRMGLQWSVFEPNDQKLWEKVERQVKEFLGQEWQAGRLHGASEEDAFFVRCNENTNQPDDIHNGRLIFEVGLRWFSGEMRLLGFEMSASG